MKRWCVAMAGLLLIGSAWAGGAKPPVEASMLVTGSIEVAPDGSVMHYALNKPDELPPAVRDLLAKAVPTWKFAPVRYDGKPAIGKASMSVRVLAKPATDGNYDISVVATHFGNPDSDRVIEAKHRRAPMYPPEAIREHVTGTVYLVLRVDAAGKVVDAVAEQVDLGRSGGDIQMKRWRDLLAWSSVGTAKEWVFNPAQGDASPYRVARVPVTFNLRVNGYSTRVRYGQWNVYVPGPLQLVPWMDNKLLSGGADALPDGDIDLVGHGLHLLTPLHGA